jgi:hypothetical protein
MIAWRLVDAELAAWRRAGKTVNFWWRDDDARGPSAALDRLLSVGRRFDVPLALAVIPDRDLAALAGRLAGEGLVSPIQHGCDHIDRAGPGEPSCEFRAEAAPAEIAIAISDAWGRLSAAMNATPLYAPPWNLAPQNVVQALATTPLTHVSLYGGDTAGPIARLNAHIDVMRWRPARFRGAAAVWLRLRKLLMARRRQGSWADPIGLLTHHRNLDEPAWAFLEEFFTRAASRRDVVQWKTARALMTADRLETAAHPG